MKNTLLFVSLLLPLCAHAQAMFKAPGYVGAFTSAGSEAFTYYSAYFDGSNDYLKRTGDFTGNSDVKTGTVSFWLKMDPSSTDTSTYRFIYGNSARVAVQRNSAKNIQTVLKNSSDTTILGYTTSGGAFGNASNWNHFLISWDLSVPIVKCYINSVSNTATASPLTDDTINYTDTVHSVAATTSGTSKVYGYLSELYYSQEYIDITQESNRLKFRSAGGKPISLGDDGSTPTGTAPLVYLRFDPTAVHVNSGTGGNYVEQGDITDGGAEKP